MQEITNRFACRSKYFSRLSSSLGRECWGRQATFLRAMCCLGFGETTSAPHIREYQYITTCNVTKGGPSICALRA